MFAFVTRSAPAMMRTEGAALRISQRHISSKADTVVAESACSPALLHHNQIMFDVEKQTFLDILKFYERGVGTEDRQATIKGLINMLENGTAIEQQFAADYLIRCSQSRFVSPCITRALKDVVEKYRAHGKFDEMDTRQVKHLHLTNSVVTTRE